ncbi:hypothetical protein QTJ16_001462 [Diplocarpon rosae]|uniref:Uncharacterized protein n=1 Tax=Diplocarpon rosae TaxID=946125 RepID=A0AAD9T7P5_9HELO|nr:hypothetical protein QTJ16_001462 [Diplocarpon rosae]
MFAKRSPAKLMAALRPKPPHRKSVHLWKQERVDVEFLHEFRSLRSVGLARYFVVFIT